MTRRLFSSLKTSFRLYLGYIEIQPVYAELKLQAHLQEALDKVRSLEILAGSKAGLPHDHSRVELKELSTLRNQVCHPQIDI